MGEGAGIPRYARRPISPSSTADLSIYHGTDVQRDIALAIYEPRVQAKVELLLSRIAAQEGKPIDMTEYSMFFSFDVMGDVGKCDGNTFPFPLVTY